MLEKISKKKKKKSRTTTKLIPLVQQQEHGFCQQIGPQSGQVLVSKWKNDGGSRLFEW